VSHEPRPVGVPVRLAEVLAKTTALASAAPPAQLARQAAEARRKAARDLAQKTADRNVPQSLWATTLSPQIAWTAALDHLIQAWRWRDERVVTVEGGATIAPACTIVLSGMAGCGKDTAAAYLVPRLRSAHFALVSEVASVGDNVAFSDAPELRRAVADRRRLYRSVDYLAISDVGREASRNGASSERVMEFLQDRIDTGKMTVLTMQMDLASFVENYIRAGRSTELYERMMSRLDNAQMEKGGQPWFLQLTPGERVADWRLPKNARRLASMVPPPDALPW